MKKCTYKSVKYRSLSINDKINTKQHCINKGFDSAMYLAKYNHSICVMDKEY